MHLLFYVGMGGLIGFSVLITAPIQIVQAWMAGEWVNSLLGYLLFPFILPPTFWLLLFCNWLSRALAQLWLNRRTVVEYRRPINFLTRRWLTTPLLALILYGLWFTQLPLKANFAWHKATLEHIADEAMASPNGTLEFTPPKSVGSFTIAMAHRLPRSPEDPSGWDKTASIYEKKALEQSVTSIPIQGTWAHQGYVRDLSCKTGEIEARTFSFEQNSNNGDQEIYYLWDGWYAFQNALD